MYIDWGIRRLRRFTLGNILYPNLRGPHAAWCPEVCRGLGRRGRLLRDHRLRGGLGRIRRRCSSRRRSQVLADPNYHRGIGSTYVAAPRQPILSVLGESDQLIGLALLDVGNHEETIFVGVDRRQVNRDAVLCIPFGDHLNPGSGIIVKGIHDVTGENASPAARPGSLGRRAGSIVAWLGISSGGTIRRRGIGRLLLAQQTTAGRHQAKHQQNHPGHNAHSWPSTKRSAFSAWTADMSPLRSRTR